MPKTGAAARVEAYRNMKVGPRVKHAARLYASGAVKTKKAACEAVGLAPTYLSLLSRTSVSHPEVTSIIGEVDQAIHNKSIALSAVIALAARRAVDKVNKLMDSNNEHIALKAASDILDRNPETSKTQKLQMTSFSLDGQDAKDIAAALVRGAEVRERFASIGEGDFVKIDGENNGKDPSSSGISNNPQGGEKASGTGDSGERPSGTDEDKQTSRAVSEVSKALS